MLPGLLQFLVLRDGGTRHQTLVCTAVVVIEGMRRPLAMDWVPDLAEVFRRVAEGAMLDCGVQPRADHCKHAGPT